MARTELGFLALPQFLKGTPELSDKRSIKTGSSGMRTGFGLASNFSFFKRG